MPTTVLGWQLTYILCAAYINKYGEFDLDELIAKRDLRNTKLIQFLHWFSPTVIGTEKWRKEQKTTPFSTIVTVSDEAYIYVIMERNYNKWLYLSQRLVRISNGNVLLLKHALTPL